MFVLPSVAVRWIPFVLVLLGPNIVLGGNASPNANKVCCPPFDKRVESNGTVFCFATVSIPSDRAIIGNYLCRNLNPHANLASFHSATELTAVYSLGLPAIIGLVYEFDEFLWRDGTPVDYNQWYSYQPSMNSSEAVVEVNVYGSFSTVALQSSNNRKAFCKLEAKYTECPDCTTCILRKTDENTFCYRQVKIGSDLATLEDAIDNNICAKTFPGYDLASIHSKEEHEFVVQSFVESNKLISYLLFTGLRIPQSKRGLPRAYNLFEWTDGTPVDYNDWEEVNSTLTPVWFPVNQYERRTCCTSNTASSYAYIYLNNKLWCTNFLYWPKFVLCKRRVKNL